MQARWSDFSPSSRCCVAMLVCLVAFSVPTCQDGSDKGEESAQKESDTVAIRDINIVLAEHDDELLALAGVVGVAVGELDDHTPCLLIMLAEENAETRKKIPANIEGHPTKIVVSGEIEPM